jgi:hypothetical protein
LFSLCAEKFENIQSGIVRLLFFTFLAGLLAFAIKKILKHKFKNPAKMRCPYFNKRSGGQTFGN